MPDSNAAPLSSFPELALEAASRWPPHPSNEQTAEFAHRRACPLSKISIAQPPLPAVSFPGGFQTPAGPSKTCAHPSGRHLKPITIPETAPEELAAKGELVTVSGLNAVLEKNVALRERLRELGLVIHGDTLSLRQDQAKADAEEQHRVGDTAAKHKKLADDEKNELEFRIINAGADDKHQAINNALRKAGLRHP